MKDWAESITSGANMTGRLLVTFMIFCNIIAMVLYIIDVQSGLMEECVSWEEKITIQIDFALGIIFTLHSLLRLTAAETFFSWLLSLPTIIDIITLPSLFLSVWLKRTWIGCRYFRFCMLMVLQDVLVGNLRFRLIWTLLCPETQKLQLCSTLSFCFQHYLLKL